MTFLEMKSKIKKRLLSFKTQRFSSPWFLLLGAVVGIPILGFLIWRIAWALSPIPDQNWQEVTSFAQLIASVLTLGPIIWAIFQYKRLVEDQRKAKHYQAWQAISDAQGKPGSGGRRQALEDLYADGVPLVGVDLSGGAYLENLKLQKVDLSVANLAGANLTEANFQQAYLLDTNFQGAYLLKTNLQEAYMPEVNLQEAYMPEANLQEADLAEANLQGANLALANLQRANLGGANLQEAKLTKANLQGADLTGANLQEADLAEANLQGANLTLANLQGVSLMGANLQGANLTLANLQGASLMGANLQKAVLLEADLSTSRDLTREQILSTSGWQGAALPSDLKDLELPVDAPEEELDRLGRSWKTVEE